MNTIITGASKGIGRALVEKFASEGHNLAICARNEENLKSLKKELETKYNGFQVLIQSSDISKRKDVLAFAEAALKMFGSIDVLINNGGIFLSGSTCEENEGTLETFYNLEELNAVNLEKLEILNSKKYKGSPYSRKELYREREQPTMIALPYESFKLKKVVLATVQRNYYVQLSENHHYYSGPYSYPGKKVKVLFDQHMIEIFYEGERIAVLQRNNLSKAYHTIQEHMPSNHQHALQVRGWNQEDLLKQASNLGLHVLQVAEPILASSFYPEQNYKSWSGGANYRAFSRSNEQLCARNVQSGG